MQAKRLQWNALEAHPYIPSQWEQDLWLFVGLAPKEALASSRKQSAPSSQRIPRSAAILSTQWTLRICSCHPFDSMKVFFLLFSFFFIYFFIFLFFYYFFIYLFFYFKLLLLNIFFLLFVYYLCFFYSWKVEFQTKKAPSRSSFGKSLFLLEPRAHFWLPRLRVSSAFYWTQRRN